MLVEEHFVHNFWKNLAQSSEKVPSLSGGYNYPAMHWTPQKIA